MNTTIPTSTLDAVREALEISAGYVALVAGGNYNMPIRKERAASDCDIISSAIALLDAIPPVAEPGVKERAQCLADMPDLFGDISQKPQPKLARWYDHYYRIIRVALSAGDEVGRWQPIETAPKDGTPIIGARFDEYDFVQRLWWQPEFDAWIKSCRRITMRAGYTINGKETDLHSPEIYRPTHWKPYVQPAARQRDETWG